MTITNRGETIEAAGQAVAPALSAAGAGRIYFDSALNIWRVSENAGAYVPLLSSAGPATLQWACAGVGVLTVARFPPQGGTPGSIGATDINKIPVGRASTLRNFFVRQQAAGTDAIPATINTYKIRVNGIASALTVALANISIVGGSDLVNTVAVIAGDEISEEVTKDNAPTGGATNIISSVELGAP